MNTRIIKPFRIALLCIVSILNSCSSSKKSDTNDVISYQEKLVNDYNNPETSPIKGDELALFKANGGISFFEINPVFTVMAYFKKNPKLDTVLMPTSSEVIKSFDAYGTARFKLNGQDYNLTIYQSHQSRQNEEYKNYLFLPFTDMTSGKTTYKGGRYIDIMIPSGDSILIDFNKAYHPYCAYTSGYSCPVPPAENYLSLPIEVGVKFNQFQLNNKPDEYHKASIDSSTHAQKLDSDKNNPLLSSKTSDKSDKNLKTNSTYKHANKILSGKVKPSDDELTFACMDSLVHGSNSTRGFYYKVFTKMQENADGALAEGLAWSTMELLKIQPSFFLEKYPIMTRKEKSFFISISSFILMKNDKNYEQNLKDYISALKAKSNKKHYPIIDQIKIDLFEEIKEIDP